MKPVTDPAVLATLEGKSAPVTDPAVLQELNRPTKPTGPTQADIERYGPQAGMSAFDKFVTGAGAATSRAIEGVKGLVGADTTEEAEDRRLYEKYHPGGWATAGEVGADVAMSAIPIGAVNKAAQGARVVAALPKAVARFAPATADIAANTAYSAATAPENRGEAALYGGGGALGGRVLTRTLGGAVRPSKPAQELMDQGVRLTPGQAGEGLAGKAAGTYERSLASVPIIGSPVTTARRAALDDWQKVLAQEVRPQGAEVRSIADVGDAYRHAYSEALPSGMVIKPSPDVLASIKTHIEDLTDNLPPSSQTRFTKIATWVEKQLGQGVESDRWKEIIGNEIDIARDAAKKKGQNALVEALDELGNHTDALGSMYRPIAQLDQGYKDFLVLKKAGEKAGALRRGAITPDELLQTATKAGNERLADLARTAQPILQGAQGPQGIEKVISQIKGLAGATAGHVLVSGATIPAAVTSLLGTTEIGRKVLLGQYPWQRLVQEYPELGAKIMRAWVNSSQEQPQPGGR